MGMSEALNRHMDGKINQKSPTWADKVDDAALWIVMGLVRLLVWATAAFIVVGIVLGAVSLLKRVYL